MKWILVESYSDYFKANIALTKLQQEGVAAILKDENTVSINPIIGNAIGGIKLMVPEEDTDKVVSILKSWASEKIGLSRCPKCMSSDFELITKKTPENYFLGFASWLLGGFAVAKTEYQCNACQHKFDSTAD